MILATRGPSIWLVDDGDGMGHVVSGNGEGPSLPVEAILKWGYWKPVEEPELTAAFDPSKHPHVPAGSSKGGQWAHKTGPDAFTPEKQATEIEQIEEGYSQMSTLWYDETVRAGQEKGPLLEGAYRTDEAAAKLMVQDAIAAKLKGDSDFIALYDAALSGQGGNAMWGDIADQFPGAGTTEERTSALMVAAWARSSSDTDPLSMQLQQAAMEEFGITGSDSFIEERLADMRTDSFDSQYLWTDQQKAGAKKFLRAQYELTQEMFKEKGIERVTLYRGMKWKSSPTIKPGEAGFRKISTNPLSSWSTNSSIADNFVSGGDYHAKVGTIVDVSRVMSTPFTGLGCLNEMEMVVLGGDDVDAFVTSWADKRLDWEGHPGTTNPPLLPAEGQNPGYGSRGFDEMWIEHVENGWF